MNLQIVTYSDCHFDGVAALWREAFPNDPPWNAAEIAVPAKVATQPDLLLVAISENRVIGSRILRRYHRRFPHAHNPRCWKTHGDDRSFINLAFNLKGATMQFGEPLRVGQSQS